MGVISIVTGSTNQLITGGAPPCTCIFQVAIHPGIHHSIVVLGRIARRTWMCWISQREFSQLQSPEFSNEIIFFYGYASELVICLTLVFSKYFISAVLMHFFLNVNLCSWLWNIHKSEWVFDGSPGIPRLGFGRFDHFWPVLEISWPPIVSLMCPFNNHRIQLVSRRKVQGFILWFSKDFTILWLLVLLFCFRASFSKSYLVHHQSTQMERFSNDGGTILCQNIIGYNVYITYSN